MYDLIIIGAGPAGITAGIYAKRANLKVAVIERGAPGGQMVNTSEIENYPGFEKLPGGDLSLAMFNHGMALGVEYLFDEVKEIKQGKIKEVILNSSTLKTKAIIIATGANPRKLGLKHEEALSSRGISWCAICDGPIYKDEDILVVGGGNSAVEEATYLATLAKSVTVVQKLETLTADSKSVQQLLKKDNVTVHYNSVVKEFLIHDDVTLKGVKIVNNDGKETDVFVKGVFEYIGLKPSTEAFRSLGILNQYGYIDTNEFMETKLYGIYAAGDVRSKQIRQVVTATSDGAIATQNVLKYLETWE